MIKFLFYPFLILISLNIDNDSETNLDAERQWSQFRGYMASGFLDQANLPETFDINSGENVKCKKKVPGL